MKKINKELLIFNEQKYKDLTLVDKFVAERFKFFNHDSEYVFNEMTVDGETLQLKAVVENQYFIRITEYECDDEELFSSTLCLLNALTNSLRNGDECSKKYELIHRGEFFFLNNIVMPLRFVKKNHIDTLFFNNPKVIKYNEEVVELERSVGIILERKLVNEHLDL